MTFWTVKWAALSIWAGSGTWCSYCKGVARTNTQHCKRSCKRTSTMHLLHVTRRQNRARTPTGAHFTSTGGIARLMGRLQRQLPTPAACKDNLTPPSSAWHRQCNSGTADRYVLAPTHIGKGNSHHCTQNDVSPGYLHKLSDMSIQYSPFIRRRTAKSKNIRDGRKHTRGLVCMIPAPWEVQRKNSTAEEAMCLETLERCEISRQDQSRALQLKCSTRCSPAWPLSRQVLLPVPSRCS